MRTQEWTQEWTLYDSWPAPAHGVVVFIGRKPNTNISLVMLAPWPTADAITADGHIPPLVDRAVAEMVAGVALPLVMVELDVADERTVRRCASVLAALAPVVVFGRAVDQEVMKKLQERAPG